MGIISAIYELQQLELIRGEKKPSLVKKTVGPKR